MYKCIARCLSDHACHQVHYKSDTVPGIPVRKCIKGKQLIQFVAIVENNERVTKENYKLNQFVIKSIDYYPVCY